MLPSQHRPLTLRARVAPIKRTPREVAGGTPLMYRITVTISAREEHTMFDRDPAAGADRARSMMDTRARLAAGIGLPSMPRRHPAALTGSALRERSLES